MNPDDWPEERMNIFLSSLYEENPRLLQETEAMAREERIPVIRPQTQGLLRTLLAAKAPKHLLEIGGAIGFSALFFCEHGPRDMKVTTIELDQERAERARELIEKAGRSEQILVLEGDASDILPALTGTYDFIFQDAAKGQYLHWLDDILALMHEGSMLVTDNILMDLDLIRPHVLLERRDRTIYRRLRAYLYRLTHDPSVTTSILPVADGVSITVKL